MNTEHMIQVWKEIIDNATCMSDTHIRALAKTFSVTGEIDAVKAVLINMIDMNYYNKDSHIEKYIRNYDEILEEQSSLANNLYENGASATDAIVSMLFPVSQAAHDKQECHCYI